MTQKPKPSMTNNWGIPNWLVSNSYGDTRRWPEVRWRWEFLRRREDCRADFLAHKDDFEVGPEQMMLRWLEGTLGGPLRRGGRRLRPDEPGFLAPVPGCSNKYGIFKLPNPAIGNQPCYTFEMFLKGSCPAMVVFPEGANITEVSGETGSVFGFDLTAPLGEQLAIARQLLEWTQKSKIGKLVKPGKKHPTKWLMYLRVLDAKESGATLSEIAKSGVLNGRQETVQTARDVLKQAKALCSKWPV